MSYLSDPMLPGLIGGFMVGLMIFGLSVLAWAISRPQKEEEA